MRSSRPRLGTVPNLLSMSRIVAAPLLLVAAWWGEPSLFVALYVFCLLTDGTDGFLARRMHVESALGARLDSIGDCVMCLSLPWGAYLLWPDMIRGELPYITAALTCYLLPILAGVARYHRMPSFHTWGAKASAVIVAVALVLMFTLQATRPFRLCLPLLILESAEELVIVAVLPRSMWQTDIPTIWHAFAIRNRRRRTTDRSPDAVSSE